MRLGYPSVTAWLLGYADSAVPQMYCVHWRHINSVLMSAKDYTKL
jgi:hypothetical protein